MRVPKIPSCHPDSKYFAKGLCRKCYGKQWLKRRQNDPIRREKHNAVIRAYTKRKIKDPIYLEKKRSYDRAYKKVLRKKNPAYKAKQYAATKEWLAKHPGYEKGRGKRRWATNPDAARAAVKRYYAKHPEKRAEFKRAWKVSHREQYLIQMRAYVKHRKALKKGAPISDFTAGQWEQMKIDSNHTCFYCGTQSESITQDHCIPLSRGGSHTASNIVPACGLCNNKKNNKTQEEYLSTCLGSTQTLLECIVQ